MNPIQILDRPIAFHRALVEVTGSVTGALLLSQAIYWQNRCHPNRDGWWWKTAEDWHEETGMSRHELDSARRACKGILEHKRKGIPCKSFYRVNEEKLTEALELANKSAGIRQTGLPESGELVDRKAANSTETPSETTTESSNISPPVNGKAALAKTPRLNSHELSYEEIVQLDRRQSVCRWYRRRENTKWTEKELKAFREVVTDTDEEDFTALDRYYSARIPKERDFRRRQMITLFNNWPGEIDRARRWVEENGESMDLDEDGNKWAKVIE